VRRADRLTAFVLLALACATQAEQNAAAGATSATRPDADVIWRPARLDTHADAALREALLTLFHGAAPHLAEGAFLRESVVTLEPGAGLRPNGQRRDGRLPAPPVQIQLESDGRACRLRRSDTGSAVPLTGVTCAPDATD
jgi:hypothetical protein